MDAPELKRRSYCPAPGWLVYGSLAVTGLLFLSERWHWFWFNEHKGWTVLMAVAGVGAVMAVMVLWWAVALVFRWRFQFSIRSLSEMVVAVALPCSWLAVEMKKASEHEEVVEAIYRMGGGVDYDWTLRADDTVWFEARPPSPKWLRRLLGEIFFADVAGVYLHECNVTDDWLKHIEDWRQLHTLHLSISPISDAGLEHIKRFAELRCLLLLNTNITDRGMKCVGSLPQLARLSIRNTKVTDSGLKDLMALVYLQELDVHGTLVTSEGIERLHRVLPNCKIIR
ncbi:MAG: hypothetical protein ACLQNE_00560 [Thermoguttaceae bacterium]